MSQNSGGIGPFDWRALVGEALRRRKAERMTQREHAALASVSIPTIAAFDRGETTLTLAKAFDILRVVGLIDEPTEEGAQDAFLREAVARWRTLTETLPPDSPGRFPNGYYRFDYWLEGELKAFSVTEFEEVLRQAVIRYSNFPAFWVPKRATIAPREIDGVLECWLSPELDGRFITDPEHCDFWRATPTGRLFLMRGYREDGQETFAPGTIFDATLPVRHMGETLVHAGRLAALMRATPAAEITVHFRALYSGLSGRVLRSWSNPMSDLLVEGHAARGDEAMSEAVLPAAAIDDHLAEYLFPLVASLYERFGVTGLAASRVKAEIDRFLQSRAI